MSMCIKCLIVECVCMLSIYVKYVHMPTGVPMVRPQALHQELKGLLPESAFFCVLGSSAQMKPQRPAIIYLEGITLSNLENQRGHQGWFLSPAHTVISWLGS